MFGIQKVIGFLDVCIPIYRRWREKRDCLTSQVRQFFCMRMVYEMLESTQNLSFCSKMPVLSSMGILGDCASWDLLSSLFLHAIGMRQEMGIRVLDNCCWQVIAPLQTRLCSDNVPIETAVDKGGRMCLIIRKNDNYL